MSLRGQGSFAAGRRPAAEGGYAMAALLVALAVMAVLMSVALPVWRHDARREKEEELVFRGQQYVRAIRLYNAKTRGFPPTVDALVQGRFLRRKFKDPVTGDDFELLSAANPITQPTSGSTLPGGRGQQVTIGGGRQSAPAPSSSAIGSGSAFGGTAPGGMLGVRSKSKDESIRLYQGRNHYNEWQFVYVQTNPGGVGPQRGGPGRGAPGGNPNLPVGPGGMPIGPGGRGRGGPIGPGGPVRGGPFGGPGQGGGPVPLPAPGRGRGGL